MSAPNRPRLLDLFCKEGGAAMGYYRAGFDVTGVDIEPQPRYPFRFIQDDALAYLDDLIFNRKAPYDAVHASPPCQLYSDLAVMWNAKPGHPDLIEPVRARLSQLGLPYVIENVERAPLISPVILCGSMFGLGVAHLQLRRHRLFESNRDIFGLLPPCAHTGKTIGIYGDHARDRRRSLKAGEGQFVKSEGIKLASAAMGINWMSWAGLSQAIPPAYTEWIGRQMLTQLSTTGRWHPATCYEAGCTCGTVA